MEKIKPSPLSNSFIIRLPLPSFSRKISKYEQMSKNTWYLSFQAHWDKHHKYIIVELKGTTSVLFYSCTRFWINSASNEYEKTSANREAHLVFRLTVERPGFKKLHRFCLSEIQASFQCQFRVLVIRIILTISNNKVKKILVTFLMNKHMSTISKSLELKLSWGMVP